MIKLFRTMYIILSVLVVVVFLFIYIYVMDYLDNLNKLDKKAKII